MAVVYIDTHRKLHIIARICYESKTMEGAIFFPGVKMCPPGALMLFLDVDLSISPSFLDRVRANTVQGEQVVFPIMFSQFDPGVVESYANSKWAKPAKLLGELRTSADRVGYSVRLYSIQHD